MKITGKVVLKLSGLIKFRKRTAHIPKTGPLREAVEQWANRYAAYAKRHFVKASRGGGEWARLKQPRRDGRDEAAAGKKKKKKQTVNGVAVLRHTNTLYKVLDTEFADPGSLEKHDSYGVTVGFGGPSMHPTGGKATIADVASFHNNGEGSLPIRQIIIPVDGDLEGKCARDMERGLKREADKDLD